MATIKDIARACDVSVATVSNVITGKVVVHPRTYQRVQQAIRQMGYRPNAVARGLVRRRMDTLGVVYLHATTVWQSNPYFGSLLDGIMAVTTRAQMNTTLYTTSTWEQPGEGAGLGSLQARVSDGRCDGVLLLVPPMDSALVSALAAANLPVVLVSSKDGGPRVSSVDVDNEEAARDTVAYLLGLGHRRIAMAIRPADAEFVYGRERLAGYRRGLEDAGVGFDPSLLVDPEAFAGPVGRWREDLAEAPTAVFCVSDYHALHLMSLLAAHGLRVPQDISVVGFDDLPAAAGADPPLTTRRQPIPRLGERAAELLLDQIAGRAAPGAKELLPTELIVRQSSGPPGR